MKTTAPRDLTNMADAEIWRGRTMGELSPDERKEVLRRSMGKLKAELESPEMRSAIQTSAAKEAPNAR